MNIKPVTDLRYKFSEIEEDVKNGDTIFLTKNGYGTMVLMSIDTYSSIANQIDDKLLEAETLAMLSDLRLSHEEVFGKIRRDIFDDKQ